MCDWPHLEASADESIDGALPRRTLLSAMAASVVVAGSIGLGGTSSGRGVVGAPRSRASPLARGAHLPAPVPVAAGLEIAPRDAWGADLAAGPIQPETPRFLLVHHTASPNSLRNTRDVLRSGYAYQTGPAKRWPDVCYQFFIDPSGAVWEGRSGSLAGPVMADATGGNQGWAQLVCLVGDYSSTAPSDAMIDSLVVLLEWIARRDGIDVTPGATATFVSRGSQRWAAGRSVTTPTIAAHRDMSYTVCPGDPVVARLPEIRQRVSDVHALYTAPIASDPHPNGLEQARRLGRISNP